MNQKRHAICALLIAVTAVVVPATLYAIHSNRPPDLGAEIRRADYVIIGHIVTTRSYDIREQKRYSVLVVDEVIGGALAPCDSLDVLWFAEAYFPEKGGMVTISDPEAQLERWHGLNALWSLSALQDSSGGSVIRMGSHPRLLTRGKRDEIHRMIAEIGAAIDKEDKSPIVVTRFFRAIECLKVVLTQIDTELVEQ